MKFIKRNLKNIIIAILSILFLIASITIYYLTNKDNFSNELKTITGTVIIADKSYVLIETDIDDYLVKDIKGSYIIGDTVEFKYYRNDLIEEDSLKTIKLVNDEELIKRLNNIDEENNNYIDNNINNSNAKPNNNSSNINNNNNMNNSNRNDTSSDKNTSISNKEDNKINNNISDNNNFNLNVSNETVTTASDVKVLSYFNNLNNDFNSSTIKDSLKNGFITVVDFIFYEGEIKGYTFNELSDSAKLKILSMALYFDAKIETYFPGYKESISNSTSKIYTTVKEEVVSNYLELATIVCTKDSGLCDTAKSGFDNIKDKFGLSWALIKDIAGDGLTNLKNWYEIWSGK